MIILGKKGIKIRLPTKQSRKKRANDSLSKRKGKIR